MAKSADSLPVLINKDLLGGKMIADPVTRRGVRGSDKKDDLSPRLHPEVAVVPLKTRQPLAKARACTLRSCSSKATRLTVHQRAAGDFLRRVKDADLHMQTVRKRLDGLNEKIPR
jgi:hypothetical protein